MVKVGDRVRLSSGKAPDREGVVTAVTGSMLRLRWPSADESTVVPAPGTLTVLPPSGEPAPPTVRPGRAAPTRVAAKKTNPKKTNPKKTAAKKSSAKTTAAKTNITKKAAPSKKRTAKNTGQAKRSPR